MDKRIKSLFIVILICVLTAGTTVLLYLLDPKFESNAYIVSSLVISAVWAFFFLPALIFAIVWVKDYFEGLNFEQGFRLGYCFGCGWGVLAVLLFLCVAPVIGIIWFTKTIKTLRNLKINERNAEFEDDVFDL